MDQELSEIITNLTRAEAGGDENAKARLNWIFGQLANDPNYGAYTDLYWATLDLARAELQDGKPEIQPTLPCPRTPRPKQKARSRSRNSKRRNYAVDVLAKRNAI